MADCKNGGVEGLDGARTLLSPMKAKLAPRAIVDAGDARPRPTSILWLQVDVNHKHFDLQRICEAVSLLALLQHADPFEWRQQVARIWPSNAIELEFVSHTVVMGVELRHLERIDSWQLVQDHFLRRDPPSDTFIKASERLLPRVQERKRRAHLSVPLVIKIQRGTNGIELTRRVKQSRAVADAQFTTLAKERSVPTSHPHYLLEGVESEFLMDGHLDCEELRNMRAIQDCGVRPPRLMPLRRSEDDCRIMTATLLRSLLSLDGEQHGVDTVQFTRLYESSTALLSAVQHSPSVKTVDISFYDLVRLNSRHFREDMDQDDAWRWIAYSLFSKHATHAIEQLRIDFDSLTDNQLHIVREVLSSDDPLAEVIVDADDYAGRLSAQRFHLRDGQITTSADVVEARTPSEVPIIKAPASSEDEWWKVWLPAYGDAFVHSRDILKMIPANKQPLGPHDSRVFPMIQLTKGTWQTWDESRWEDWEDDTPWELGLGLLQMIGRGTKELIVADIADEIDEDDFVRGALAACPLVKTLELVGVGLLGLQVFVDSAVAGLSTLQRIVSDSICITETDTVSSFFRALEDPTHPLTQHLEEIDLTFRVRMYQGANPLWRAALAMLRKNRSLRVVQLAVEVSEPPGMAENDVSSTELGRLPACAVATGPLPLRSKLAFLSGVVGHGECRLEAARQLDAHVVSRIFQFAVPSVERRVLLLCTGPGMSVEFNMGSDDEDIVAE